MSIAERQRLAVEASAIADHDLDRALESSVLERASADSFIENTLGTFALPYSLLPPVRVSERRVAIPLVTDSSRGGRLARAASIIEEAGGVTAESTGRAPSAERCAHTGWRGSRSGSWARSVHRSLRRRPLAWD